MFKRSVSNDKIFKPLEKMFNLPIGRLVKIGRAHPTNIKCDESYKFKNKHDMQV